MPFPFALAHLGAKPLEPFGKGSNALKAGTPAAEPEVPPVPGALNAGTAVRSAPGRGRAEGALYARPARKGKAIEVRLRLSGWAWRAPGSTRRAAPPIRRL